MAAPRTAFGPFRGGAGRAGALAGPRGAGAPNRTGGRPGGNVRANRAPASLGANAQSY